MLFLKVKRINVGVLGDLLVVFGLTIFSVWYLIDAYIVSNTIENLLLILPVGIIVLVLGVVIVWRILKILGENQCVAISKLKGIDSESGNNGCTTIYGMCLFVCFVFSLEFIGFDLAGAIFIGLYLRLLGERRIGVLVLYPLGFILPTTYFFTLMLPYPFETFLPFKQ